MAIRTSAGLPSPLFEQALDATDLSESTKARIKQHVATYGSCQTLDELPAALRHAFVVSADISAEEHVLMQAAIQAFTDNSISKTSNFPEGATEEDVAKTICWRGSWLQGADRPVTGSRRAGGAGDQGGAAEKEELTSPLAETGSNGQYANGRQSVVEVAEGVIDFTRHGQRQRPTKLLAPPIAKGDAVGHGSITVNSDERNRPFEGLRRCWQRKPAPR
ncbi:MAG: hypothetical protein IPM07_30350 [Anaerolineales bacterium]|nr:hypothetical protein [Anaerolineales bacterium]